MEGVLRKLTTTFAMDGTVRWIGVRPDRREPMVVVDSAQIEPTGLVGDRRATPGKRAVSLIQWEHLPVIAALLGKDVVAPEQLRRNIAVSGINLLGLRKAQFRIGTALLRGTGLCAPCSRMEEELGQGGYSAVRGHGGITAEVIEAGTFGIGADIVPLN